MTEPEAKPTVLIPEPGALSSEYYKGRQQLMLWAGVLFIWELVGIDLGRAAESGGNVGSLLKSIKSPQAVPWALLILVAYFLFKVTVEWYQSSLVRRNMRASRIDFYSAWIISVMAYALYFGQTISHVQFANLLNDNMAKLSIILGTYIGVTFAIAGVSLLIRMNSPEGAEPRFRVKVVLASSGAVALLICVFVARAKGTRLFWSLVLIGIACGATFTVGPLLLEFWLRQQRWMVKQYEAMAETANKGRVEAIKVAVEAVLKAESQPKDL
jgi:hypothetical protein